MKVVKRIFDVAISLIAIVLLSPLLAFIACLLLLYQGKPVLFRQLRAGYKGRPFHILKFRTMTTERNADGEHLADEFRITPIGRFLRATSLDELPELVNVVRGEMSLVGPRPLLVEYLPLYDAEQARRHEVRPGITGWAQVNGRNAISWEEKLRLDTYYVDHWSFLLDMKILLLTVIQVISRKGISAEGHATAPRFTGSTSRGPTA